MKKPIAAYEDFLDEKAKTTYEKDLDKEVTRILELLHNKPDMTTARGIIKVLVSKGIVSEKDFKIIIGEK